MAFKWLKELNRLGRTQQQDNDHDDGLQLALAVLMLEVAHSDFQEDEVEINIITNLLESADPSGQARGNSLLDRAKKEKEESAGLYQYTRLACEQLSVKERAELVEKFWQIAYADGVVDKYEEAAIRKASDLLYVPHSDYMRAKQSAALKQAKH